MNYRHHLEACAFVAVFVTLFTLVKGVAQTEVVIELWKGFIPYMTIITCDLDSETSTVTKLWGPFKVIWHPFTQWGHREILHHWVYGPFILIGLWLLPVSYVGYHVSELLIIGAVLMLWTHIITDKFYSGIKKIIKKIIPKWFLKWVKKVI